MTISNRYKPSSVSYDNSAGRTPSDPFSSALKFISNVLHLYIVIFEHLSVCCTHEASSPDRFRSCITQEWHSGRKFLLIDIDVFSAVIIDVLVLALQQLPARTVVRPDCPLPVNVKN